jgi:hypothetical protein
LLLEKDRAVAAERDRQEVVAALNHAEDVLAAGDLAAADLALAENRLGTDGPADLATLLATAKRDRDLELPLGRGQAHATLEAPFPTGWRQRGQRGHRGLAFGFSQRIPLHPAGGGNLTDLALIGHGLLTAAAYFWYFIGHQLFGGDRLYPTGVLLLAGLTTLVIFIAWDMEYCARPGVRVRDMGADDLAPFLVRDARADLRAKAARRTRTPGPAHPTELSGVGELSPAAQALTVVSVLRRASRWPC